jgi:hypothetical protein
VLAFLVPVKSPLASRDWNRLSALFERSLRSICRQDSDDFTVTVVCNERPRTCFEHPAVRYLDVDMPPADNTAESREADRARKLQVGAAELRHSGASHIMAVDADDCVSRRIASVVNNSPTDAPGWLLREGYVWKEGSRVSYRNVKNFNHTCGSTAITRRDLFEHMFRAGPRYTFEEPALPAGIQHGSFPFAAVVYTILNGENIFLGAGLVESARSREGVARFYARKAVRYRPALVTRSLQNEFGLYDLPA